MLKVMDKHGNFIRKSFEVNITSLLLPPEVVTIPDANLASAIRGALKLKTKTITQLDMLGLRDLRAYIQKITDLPDLNMRKI